MIKAKISSGSMRGHVDPYARMKRHIEAPELDHADGSVTKRKLSDDVLALLGSGSGGSIYVGSDSEAAKNAELWIDLEGNPGSYDETSIPAYCEYEAVRVSGVIADKIKALSDAGHSSLVFGAVTDNHVANKHKWIDANGNLQEITALQDVLTKASIRHGAYALKYVSDLAGCDFIANLGDNNWENNIDSDNAYTAGMYTRDTLLPAFDEASGGCFGFYLVGNHDQTNDIARQWELIGQHNTFDVTGTTAERCYGYKDFADKKVRVICLNTSDYLNGTGGYGMSYEQRAFLMSALDLSNKEDCADWKILLLSHIPLDFYSADYDITKDVIGILQAYVNGESYTIAVNDSWASIHDDATSGTLTYDYAGKPSAKIIGNIHGHLHNDCSGALGYTDIEGDTVSTNIVRVSTPNTCFYLGKGEAYPNNGDYAAKQITKVQGTAQDTSVTFYVVDLTDNVIYSYAYGAGNDRVINGELPDDDDTSEEETPTVSYTNLFDETAVEQNKRFNSSGEIVEGSFWCMTTFLSCTEGDVLRIYIPNALWMDMGQQAACCYDSNKIFVSGFYPKNSDGTVPDGVIHSEDDHTLTVTIPSGVSFFRVSGHPATNYGNVIITINEEIAL